MARKVGKGSLDKNETKRKSSVLEVVSSKNVEKQNYTVRINKEVGEKFQKFCKENGVSMSDMVEEFFKRELER